MSNSDDHFTIPVFLALICFCLAAILSGVEGLKKEKDILALHNDFRVKFGLRPLILNASLGVHAEAWGREIWNSGHYHHSNISKAGGGENIAWRSTSGVAVLTKDSLELSRLLYEQWEDEFDKFKYGVFPNNSVDGSDITHVTQILWAKTISLGCSLFRNNTHALLVCNYYPFGNIKGQYPF